MTAQDLLCRHFSRIGARVRIRDPLPWPPGRVRIDISSDHRGEFFDVRCEASLTPEIVDVRPALRHLVLMVRDGSDKNKFLLGHDERHWFAAAIPDDAVRDVRTAMKSLRPAEAAGEQTIRQGEWFFVPTRELENRGVVIHRSEPLSRGAGSKPHVCDEVTRRAGVTVMVSQAYPLGVSLPEYDRLIASSRNARRMRWQRMTRDAEVFARGRVRHSDHKTIYLDGWHRVYMNRERFARNATQIAFLD